MKKIKAGLVKAISSAIIGFFVTTVVTFLANKGYIPSYSIIILSVFNMITSILTMLKMRRWGIYYAIGWVISSAILAWIGLLGTTGIIFNIVIPVIILLIRFVLWLSKQVIPKKTRKRKTTQT
ncbi:MAG TPA: hypothetical protein VEH58_03355 [Dehalococcoidales bacterium]|nr:hypothetical protein [Dehalococcoidales bacterium]